MIIREIKEVDFPFIIKIENSSYDSPEELSVLKEKWINDSTYCFVAAEGTEVMGFIIAYPASIDHVAELHSKKIETVNNDKKSSIYIHDLAVSGNFKGMSIGSKLFKHVWKTAKENRLTRSHLVAVTKIASIYWGKSGYRPTDIIASEYGYEDEATVMCCNIK